VAEDTILSLEAMAIEDAAADAAAAQNTPAADSRDVDGNLDADATDAIDDDGAADVSEPDPQDGSSSAASDIRAIIKDTYGVDLESKYADSDSALKGLVEAYKTVGRKNEDAELGRWLRQQGVEPSQIAAAIQSIRGQQPQQAQQPQQNPQAAGDFFDPRWITTDQKGQVIPTSLAPSDIEQRYARHIATQTQRLLNLDQEIERRVAEAIAKAKPEIGQEALSATERRMREEREGAEAREWAQRNRDLLWVNGQVGGNMTPLAATIEDKMRHIDPNMPWAERLDLAKSWAIAERKPEPQKRQVPVTAKRQQAPAAQPAKKITEAEFEKMFPNASLLEHQVFDETGELPKR
jgi:hypothetical protein